MFDFDQPIDRRGSQCEKYDARLQKFGRDDVIPLWVADMDFAAPPCVQQALAARLAHPVFGYSSVDDSLLEALYGWYRRRHHWQLEPEQLLLTPGVVPSLFAAVNALTEPGDGVLVPTPVYPPFFSAVQKNDRLLLQSPLLATDGGYLPDWDDLEKQAAHASMLLWCSPHNPVGRVWRREELERLTDLCLRHDLVLVSDDIHCDLVYPGQRHLPLAKLAPPELRLLTAVSPSKSFNIPGLNLSALLLSHEADRQAVKRVFTRSHANPFNPFTMAAFQAAYEKGDDWLDALLDYLDGNRRWLHQQLQALDGIDSYLPEASCLMWLDCRGLGMNDASLRDFFVQEAGLGLNDGASFGQGGSGFMRWNIGSPRATQEKAMAQLREACSRRA